MEKAQDAGARHGKEIASQDDFMTVAVEEAGGEIELLDAALAAAERAAADRYAQDEQEGTKRTRAGMMFVSPGKGRLGIACLVPQEHHEKATAHAWMQAVLDVAGGKMLEASPARAKAVCEAESGTFTTPSKKTFSQAEALGFETTAASVAWLRTLGLFPAKEEEGDDDDFIPEW